MVQKVERDLPREWFRIHLREDWSAAKETVLAAIREAGFTAVRVTGEGFGTPVSGKARRSRMPAVVSRAIERAGQEGKRYVLIDARGKG